MLSLYHQIMDQILSIIIIHITLFFYIILILLSLLLLYVLLGHPLSKQRIRSLLIIQRLILLSFFPCRHTIYLHIAEIKQPYILIPLLFYLNLISLLLLPLILLQILPIFYDLKNLLNLKIRLLYTTTRKHALLLPIPLLLL